MELSDMDLWRKDTPKGKSKLYDQFMEKGWNYAYILYAGDPASKNFVDGIFQAKHEMIGVLDLLEKSEMRNFQLTCYPYYQGEDDYVKAYMNFTRDRGIEFRLSKIELQDQDDKRLLLSIPQGNYLPERDGLIRRFNEQQLGKKPIVILARKTLRRMQNKGDSKQLEI